MPDQNKEILSIILIGGLLALGLLLFVVIILFIYQKRQHTHERELVELKEEYDQELLRSQLEIQEKTLTTIGQELHDNIGQLLSVVKLSMSNLAIDSSHQAYAGIQSTKEILNKAIVDVSNLSKSLHSDRISHIGLRRAIEFEVETIRKTGLVGIDLTTGGVENEERLDAQKSIFLFRMFQEVLNNALKHSKATHINIGILFSTDNNFTLSIKDNGVGFNVAEKQNKPSSSGGVGLKSMINRAKLIGAKFLINSIAGSGTTVTIVLPLMQDQTI